MTRPYKQPTIKVVPIMAWSNFKILGLWIADYTILGLAADNNPIRYDHV